MPSNRADARAGAADIPLQQKDINDLADRGNGVLVLGEPHGPTHDDAARLDKLFGQGVDLGPF